MAEYTTEELAEQMTRAGAYFGKALYANRKTWVGVMDGDGTLVVVARGAMASRLADAVDESVGTGKVERAGA